MIPGKNSNLMYENREIHIQTEFIASKKVILTLIFDKGAIVGSKKKKLIFDGETETYKEKITKKLLKQHNEVLNKIKKSHKKPSKVGNNLDTVENDELMENFLNEVFDVGEDQD
ncbi:MAG TPA: hypothetical protein VKN74_04340 [Candidatus Mcinerneyibacterium sp.]|nr:hypothetical protein [Candidatus Mcinerneyibacterium sp.]